MCGVGRTMESDFRYLARRASAERQAAARALTAEARARRMQLADSYMRQLEALSR